MIQGLSADAASTKYALQHGMGLFMRGTKAYFVPLDISFQYLIGLVAYS